MNPLIAQIMMFGGNFAPRGWAFCDGQLLAISSNTALFSLIGITYGGDGRTTFGLPDLRGRSAVHPGHGPGLSTIRWGERGGNEQTYLNVANLPSHTHTAVTTTENLTLQVANAPGGSDTPVGNVPARTSEDNYGPISTPAATMQAGAITGTVTVQNLNTGANMPVSNIPPFLGVYHIIALVGIFPSRS